MHLTYYTLRALALEWDRLLCGATIGAAYSQARAELSLATYRKAVESTLVVRIGGPLRFLYRRDGFTRARRNVATVLPGAIDRRVEQIYVPERDRHLYIDLHGGTRIQITPFGPKPNVYLTGPDGTVTDAFLRREAVIGMPAPEARTAPHPDSLAMLSARWDAEASSAERALTKAVPLYDYTLARETLARADVDPAAHAALGATELERIWVAFLDVERSLTVPRPAVYGEGGVPVSFSLVTLHHLRDQSREDFSTVDEAVSVFVRRTLAHASFRERFVPVQRALVDEASRLEQSIVRMQAETNAVSRADRYEHWAHVLMALAAQVPAGAAEVTLPDVFEADRTVRIPLDPARSAVENATTFYDKARQTRTAREHAKRRLQDQINRMDAVHAAMAELSALERAQDVRDFEARHAALLEPLLTASGRKTGDEPRFRRFELAGGYEVLVGKTAAQNDLLTFKRASKHDFWLHARGVPGSHVLLRVPGKQVEPPPFVLEAAASIAAHFSRASGSHLVPVTVTRRKYVRKAKHGPPGAVLVEREEVLIVPPRLPGAASD